MFFRELSQTDEPPVSHTDETTSHVSASSRASRRVLFASAHSIVDFSNGASVATLDVLHGLCASGFECRAFCTPKLDLQNGARLEHVLDESRELYQVLPAACGTERARILYTQRGHIPITVVNLDSSPQVSLRPDDVHTVLGFFRSFLELNQPDVMLTYGGDPITNALIDMARRRGIPIVFAIHNLQYFDPRPFANVDFCIVPSQFTHSLLPGPGRP